MRGLPMQREMWQETKEKKTMRNYTRLIWHYRVEYTCMCGWRPENELKASGKKGKLLCRGFPLEIGPYIRQRKVGRELLGERTVNNWFAIKQEERIDSRTPLGISTGMSEQSCDWKRLLISTRKINNERDRTAQKKGKENGLSFIASQSAHI